ncbi:hypothetical protein [Streptomyces sp. NPDC020917]|uniref:hypothetical protein n=1 Tax=Streptomyces sp. NPDC020917 TaxID=3365102 RepID=UPI0037ABDD23
MSLLLRDAHLTYPHSNGFHADGDRVALVRYDLDAARIFSVRWRPDEARDERVLHELPPDGYGTDALVLPDFARDTGRMAVAHDDVLWVADPGGSLEPVWRAPAGLALDHLLSLTHDGSRVAVGTEGHNTWSGWEIEVSTGTATRVFQKTWWANHIARSPYDERWIAFSHEGIAIQTPDRVWAWHPERAPNGMCVLDQYEISERPGAFVAVGHERWCHHDLAVVAVAYGDSEVGPRGLYLATPDDRPPRLVSAGDRYWHCDVSRDGRYAVVDTTGPTDAPGRGWQNAGGVSDVLLVDMADGATRRLARTQATRHPWHPHPVFAPDGSAVLFNDLGTDERGTVVVSL